MTGWLGQRSQAPVAGGETSAKSRPQTAVWGRCLCIWPPAGDRTRTRQKLKEVRYGLDTLPSIGALKVAAVKARTASGDR
jgi:hypothetical protein